VLSPPEILSPITQYRLLTHLLLAPILLAQAPALDLQLEQPILSQTRLEVSRSQRRVFVYQANRVIADYPVAIGKKGWETPLGTYHINDKIEHPAWTSFLSGRVVPPGKFNPMGSRWIGYYKDRKGEIGFHATRDVGSVGKASSHGCNRMITADVEKLYEQVAIGDEVRVVD
jgi:lipoprotein-anchoring transpeptidase ErfK/SrfK